MHMLESLLPNATHALIPERALHALAADGTCDRPMQLVRWILRNGFRHPTIDLAADTFCISTRSVMRWLHVAGAPNFAVLKGLAQLLAVRELESRSGMSRRQATHKLGYLTPSPMSRIAGRWRAGAVNAARYPSWSALLSLYPE